MASQSKEGTKHANIPCSLRYDGTIIWTSVSGICRSEITAWVGDPGTGGNYRHIVVVPGTAEACTAKTEKRLNADKILLYFITTILHYRQTVTAVCLVAGPTKDYRQIVLLLTNNR